MRRGPAGPCDQVGNVVYREAVAELVRLNPRHFLPPGVRRRWYHAIVGGIEYPSVLLVQ